MCAGAAGMLLVTFSVGDDCICSTAIGYVHGARMKVTGYQFSFEIPEYVDEHSEG